MDEIVYPFYRSLHRSLGRPLTDARVFKASLMHELACRHLIRDSRSFRTPLGSNRYYRMQGAKKHDEIWQSYALPCRRKNTNPYTHAHRRALVGGSIKKKNSETRKLIANRYRWPSDSSASAAR